MWKTHAWQHHFTKRGDLGYKRKLVYLFIEGHVPSQASGQSCIYVQRVSTEPIFTIFILNLGTGPTVWYIYSVYILILFVKPGLQSILFESGLHYSKLERDSLTLIDWFTENQMKANPDKFQAIAIGKKN